MDNQSQFFYSSIFKISISPKNYHFSSLDWAFKLICEKSGSTTEEAAIALLELIPSYYADDYDTWIKVGMALKSISPALLEAWDRWSRQSKKWKPGECAYKWGTFNGVGISDRTLYWLAQNS